MPKLTTPFKQITSAVLLPVHSLQKAVRPHSNTSPAPPSARSSTDTTRQQLHFTDAHVEEEASSLPAWRAWAVELSRLVDDSLSPFHGFWNSTKALLDLQRPLQNLLVLTSARLELYTQRSDSGAAGAPGGATAGVARSASASSQLSAAGGSQRGGGLQSATSGLTEPAEGSDEVYSLGIALTQILALEREGRSVTVTYLPTAVRRYGIRARVHRLRRSLRHAYRVAGAPSPRGMQHSADAHHITLLAASAEEATDVVAAVRDAIYTFRRAVTWLDKGLPFEGELSVALVTLVTEALVSAPAPLGAPAAGATAGREVVLRRGLPWGARLPVPPACLPTSEEGGSLVVHVHTVLGPGCATLSAQLLARHAQGEGGYFTVPVQVDRAAAAAATQATPAAFGQPCLDDDDESDRGSERSASMALPDALEATSFSSSPPRQQAAGPARPAAAAEEAVEVALPSSAGGAGWLAGSQLEAAGAQAPGTPTGEAGRSSPVLSPASPFVSPGARSASGELPPLPRRQTASPGMLGSAGPSAAAASTAVVAPSAASEQSVHRASHDGGAPAAAAAQKPPQLHVLLQCRLRRTGERPATQGPGGAVPATDSAVAESSRRVQQWQAAHVTYAPAMQSIAEQQQEASLARLSDQQPLLKGDSLESSSVGGVALPLVQQLRDAAASPAVLQGGAAVAALLALALQAGLWQAAARTISLLACLSLLAVLAAWLLPSRAAPAHLPAAESAAAPAAPLVADWSAGSSLQADSAAAAAAESHNRQSSGWELVLEGGSIVREQLDGLHLPDDSLLEAVEQGGAPGGAAQAALAAMATLSSARRGRSASDASQLPELLKQESGGGRGWLNDDIIERFTQGCAGDRNAAMQRIKATLAWRAEQRLDGLLEERQPHFEAIKRSHVHGIVGRSKAGMPVWVEHFGALRQAYQELINQGVGLEAQMRHHIFMTEWLWRVCDPAPLPGGKMVMIVDLAGGRMSDFSGGHFSLVKQMAVVSGAHYPCRLHHAFVVNVPRWFAALYGLVAPLLSPDTRAHTHVYHSMKDATAAMLKQIDADVLPVEYGGNNRRSIRESAEERQLSEMVARLNSAHAAEE